MEGGFTPSTTGATARLSAGCREAEPHSSICSLSIAKATKSSKGAVTAGPVSRSSLLITPGSRTAGKALSQPSGCTTGNIAKYSVENVLQELEVMFR
jgi:hypothetical protein